MSSKELSHTLILGHRGAPREFLENTLRSFDRALQQGADGVELDVRGSRDGVPVIVHDDALERTMGVKGKVAELAWGAIERLSGARVPSLEQVAAWAAASGAWLNLEIKAAGIEEAALEQVHRVGIADRVIYSSFDASVVRRIGELDGGVRRFFLTERWDDRAIRALEAARADGVCLRDDAADGEALARIRDRDLPVVVWTVNEAARVAELLDAGVAGIISDLPDVAAGIRERHR